MTASCKFQLLPEPGNTLVQEQNENGKHEFLLIMDFLTN